ncbi:MAG: RrF2 family transcriptional regulator [Saprospiraceae bacterium]
MFSKACKYGMRAVLYLAVHSNEEQKLGVKEIAEALNVPRPFLAKIMQQLSRAQLISSSKGPTGGFYLSEKNARASLRQVVDCMDGNEVFTACIMGLPVCGAEHPCPLHSKAFAYREGLVKLLSEHTIAEFAKRIDRMKLTI